MAHTVHSPEPGSQILLNHGPSFFAVCGLIKDGQCRLPIDQITFAVWVLFATNYPTFANPLLQQTRERPASSKYLQGYRILQQEN